MDLFTLVAKLTMDASEYERGISQSKQSFFSMADSISAKAVAVGTMVAHGVERAASTLIDFGKYAVQTSADVEAEIALYQQVFGELESAATGTLESISQDTNILSTRLRGIGTSAFMQFKGAGIDAGNALTMMDKYTRLAADAAAAFNISIEDADQKLRSFIRGNTEAGDSINLFTSESQRNERALATYGQKWQALTEAQKQMIMLNIVDEIYQQSEVIGQAGRESESWEVNVGNLTSSFEILSATVGGSFQKKISPVIKKLSEFFSDDTVLLRLGMLTSSIADIAGKAFDGAIGFIDRLIAWSNGEKVEPVRFDIEIPTWEELSTTVAEKVSAIVSGIESIANWTLGAFGLPDVDSIIADVKNWWNGQGHNAYERIKKVLSWGLGEFVVPGVDSIVGRLLSWWDETGRGAVQAVLDWTVGELIMPAWVDLVYSVYSWWTNDIRPKIKELADWELGEVHFPSWSEISEKATAWWNSIEGLLSDIFTVNIRASMGDTSYTGIGSAGSLAEGIDAITSPTMQIPGRAVGLDYVPYDNYFARLHEGEAVLTRSEATAWRRGEGSTQGPTAAEIGAAVADAMREVLNGMGVYMGADRVGDLVTERVSRNIARDMRNRRYQPV